jgi:hypothetical protein
MARLVLGLGVVLCVCVAAQAQQPPSNYERLKVLEPFLGPWVYEGPFHIDVPGVLKDGAEVRIPFLYTWDVNKNAVVMNWSIQAEGKDALAGVVLIGWDPRGGRIVDRAFTSAGSHSRGVWTVDGKTLTIKGQETAPDGTQTSSTIINRLTDRGTMIWQATNRVRGGEKLADIPECEFKPLKPLAFKDFQDYGESMLGKWEAELVLAGDMPGIGKTGDKVKASADIAWMFDKKGLEFKLKAGGVSSRWLCLWDPGSGRITQSGCDSTGASCQGGMTKEGASWVARRDTTYPDGTKWIVKDTMIVQDAGNTHIHVGTDVTLNGVKQPDYRGVWKRVKK